MQTCTWRNILIGNFDKNINLLHTDLATHWRPHRAGVEHCLVSIFTDPELWLEQVPVIVSGLQMVIGDPGDILSAAVDRGADVSQLITSIRAVLARFTALCSHYNYLHLVTFSPSQTQLSSTQNGFSWHENSSSLQVALVLSTTSLK